MSSQKGCKFWMLTLIQAHGLGCRVCNDPTSQIMQKGPLFTTNCIKKWGFVWSLCRKGHLLGQKGPLFEVSNYSPLPDGYMPALISHIFWRNHICDFVSERSNSLKLHCTAWEVLSSNLNLATPHIPPPSSHSLQKIHSLNLSVGKVSETQNFS